MAVARMAAAEDHAVRAALEGAQHEHGVHAAGAGHPDDLDVGGVAEAVVARQVSARIGAPVAAERYDQRLILVYLHIASTSAIICRFRKPFRSIAPEGQATVHAPQPWQTASLTEATRRTLVVRSGIRNSLSM